MPDISPFQPGDKVVAYCRYSEGDTQGLKNTSVDEQEQAIRRFCLQNSLQLVQVYADPFASGRSVAKRDKYLEMLSDLLHKRKSTAVAGVILWDFERYGRNYDRAQYDAAQLRMKGYKLYSMQQPIVDNSPFSHVLESMYFASAQNQSDMISADVKRALQANFTQHRVIPRTNIPDGWIAVPVKMGYYSDGRERIGYRADPDPEYKDKIAEAINARLSGASVREMRVILGGKFAKSVSAKVIAMMKKPLLYGSMTYGGTTIDDYCEPIIDKDTFDKLQAYNALYPKRRRSPGAGVYSLNRSLLSGLLVCGVCGERMHMDSRKAKGHIYSTYYCNSYHIGIRKEIIDPLIIGKAIDLLSGDQWIKDRDKLLDALAQPSETDAEEKADIEKQIREIDRKIKRLMDVILESSGSAKALLDKLTDLEKEKEDLSARLDATSGMNIDRIQMTADRLKDRILSVLQDPDSSTDEKREVLSLFISEIIVLPDGSKGCKLVVKHGLPGYLKVADNLRLKDLRPSRDMLYTCKTVIILQTRSLSAKPV